MNSERKIMPDTPWHVGYALKKENDPRRHKARCIHYDKGLCKYGDMKCCGSAHCQYYGEKETEKYKYVSYGIEHYNQVNFPNRIREFCHDSTQEIRQKPMREINQCPICGKDLKDYLPLKYMARVCQKCRILFIDEDVYKTYTEQINKSLANNILCLVKITPSREKNTVKVPEKSKRQIPEAEMEKIVTADINRVLKKGKKQKSKIDSKPTPQKENTKKVAQKK